MTSYEEDLGLIFTRLRANDNGARSATPPAADDPRVTGQVDVGPLIDFIDEPRHTADWEREAEQRDRAAHRALLRALRAPLHAAGAHVQRVQADGTLAALHGAVL